VKCFSFIFGLAAVLSHALMSWLAGSLNPADWSGMEIGVCILILAPCIALALAVLEGALDDPPEIYSRRDRRRRGE
jgi:ABC-type Fe3+-siderophore transport system permease subunit